MDPTLQEAFNSISTLQGNLQDIAGRASPRPKSRLPDPEKLSGSSQWNTWLPYIRAKLRFDRYAIGPEPEALFFYVYGCLEPTIQSLVLPQLDQAAASGVWDPESILDELSRFYGFSNEAQKALVYARDLQPDLNTFSADPSEFEQRLCGNNVHDCTPDGQTSLSIASSNEPQSAEQIVTVGMARSADLREAGTYAMQAPDALQDTQLQSGPGPGDLMEIAVTTGSSNSIPAIGQQYQGKDCLGLEGWKYWTHDSRETAAESVSDCKFLPLVPRTAFYPRYYVHRSRPRGSCLLCTAMKKRCEKGNTGDVRCLLCVKRGIPTAICISEPVTQHRPFEKWLNQEYVQHLTVVEFKGESIRKTVQLQHYTNGPTLTVICSEFSPVYGYQTHRQKQNSSGWHVIQTTPYALRDHVDIQSYVRKCVYYALSEVLIDGSPASFFLRHAADFQEYSIIRDCLEMYATLRLIQRGWQFCGEETLGMRPIRDTRSAWYGITPLPCVLRNQLVHLLELHLVDLDRRVLEKLQQDLRKKNPKMWLILTLAVFVLLHVRELDAGRNIYWARFQDSENLWIHPSQPHRLIEEAVFSCEAILWNYRGHMGLQPLNLDWDDRALVSYIDTDERVGSTMRALKTVISCLGEIGAIGRKAAVVYQNGNPRSVAFTISSLLFTDDTDIWNVSDFH